MLLCNKPTWCFLEGVLSSVSFVTAERYACDDWLRKLLRTHLNFVCDLVVRHTGCMGEGSPRELSFLAFCALQM